MTTSVQQTELAVYDMMSKEDYCLLSETDVNEIAQKVDEDRRETFLDEKIYDALLERTDQIRGTL